MYDSYGSNDLGHYMHIDSARANVPTVAWNMIWVNLWENLQGSHIDGLQKEHKCHNRS